LLHHTALIGPNNSSITIRFEHKNEVAHPI
jgi:hypothetical protein